MNTNQLKKFAQSARVKLIEQVGAKLNYVLTHDTAELRGKANTVKKLKEAVDKNGKQHVIEKVAYTWFNRLVALRFMDANGYQPIGMSVLTPAHAANSVSPELLDAAHSGSIPTDLTVDRQKILDLLDGRVSSNNPDNEVFRILLVAVCNQLHSIFPFLFEKIDDYTELLLPDDLTSSFSIVKEIVDGMPNEDCAEVEIIGWLYQFYISEKKDEVFASKSAVKKEDIPAATQLFTPRWIVEYMVQNTVGKLWLQNKPNSRLKDYMPYFIDSPSVHADDYLKVNSVEEVKLLDQACGSGHILVYGFDLFFKIYEEEGYNPNEIPSLILKNNLFGFEIDERAAQLAGFALLMKARSYYRRFFRNPIAPNILCYQDLLLSSEEIKEAFTQLGYKLSDELNHDLLTMQQATNFGSLIAPHTSLNELKKVKSLIETRVNSGDAFFQYRLEQIEAAINQLIPLCEKYHCVVDNPPYMGGGNMNKTLGDFVKTNYPDSKADLMACFMEAGINMLQTKGFLGMINQHSWMFLSSYEKLRAKLIEDIFFDTNLHLGSRTFPEIGGEVVQNAAFTFWNKQLDSKGSYLRLVDFNSTDDKRLKTIEAIENQNCGWFYTANQRDFEKIPGNPIGYWLSERYLKLFANKLLGEIEYPKKGADTGKNDYFLRLWYEVSYEKIISNSHWIFYNKGGTFRRWYGNYEYVINWKNNGSELKKSTANLRSKELYFKESITWNALSSNKFCARYSDKKTIFDSAGSSLFLNKKLNDNNTYLGFLNSKVCQEILNLINPTLNYGAGTIALLPILKIDNETIKNLSANSIEISANSWSSSELSDSFLKNGILRQKSSSLQECFDFYVRYWTNKFQLLQKNEEELNRQFIEIYGLKDELTPDVPMDEITILKEEISIENGELVFHAEEVFAQFMSYAVGCMFGRYSLDKKGLILANQGETLKEYLTKVSKNKEELCFIPDEDNVIPVLDDEWFEDDIVARFHSFLKASFGEKEFQKNLSFVEECLGKDIRKYFVKDFYKDHIKRYKKRPIYWMFSSPKGYFNVLIYMHRYTQDTLSTILNGYLREFIGKLELQRKQHEHTVVNGSPALQNRAQREIDKIDDMLADCRKYESEILYPLAGERISIDLDDGVLVNYNKFGAAIAPVDGLNDKKTKKKVMEFDWIDTTQIR
jgi:type II restriction/modification system DNA methylase subunit YeeA